MTILTGDCVELLATLPENSVDACVCDPPYDLTAGKKGGSGEKSLNLNSPAGRARISTGFMGLGWDGTGVAFRKTTWEAVYRVLKPGAHLLAFGGTRTYHRMTVAIEDAGFEIRDSIHWIYGTGFPKSKNVALGIDKGEGHPNRGHRIATASRHHPDGTREPNGEQLPAYEAKTAAAKPWAGWGTALKPAHEPIVLARKPFEVTVAENVQVHGTGAINIDASRITTGENLNGGAYAEHGSARYDGAEHWRYKREGAAGEFHQPTGRWPANVILSHSAACLLEDGPCADDCPVAELDRQSGSTTSAGGRIGKKATSTVDIVPSGRFEKGDPGFGDTGGASRFFYVAKASRSERDRGCENLPERTAGEVTGGRAEGSAGLNSPRAGAGRTTTKLVPFYKIPIPDASWVFEVLDQALPAATAHLLRTVTAGSTTHDNDGRVWSMCSCGSPSTDPSHPDIRSIIETATSSTTTIKTWSCSRRRHTNGCMAVASGVTVFGGNPASYAESSSPSTPSTGISVEKGGPSTDAAAPVTSIESWLKNEPVGEAGVRVGGARNFHPT